MYIQITLCGIPEKAENGQSNCQFTTPVDKCKPVHKKVTFVNSQLLYWTKYHKRGYCFMVWDN